MVGRRCVGKSTRVVYACVGWFRAGHCYDCERKPRPAHFQMAKTRWSCEAIVEVEGVSNGETKFS